MLGLPCSTEVNQRVTKEKLYANTNLTPQLRNIIKNQIETVIWRNKLACSTFNVNAGKTVDEIQVFEVQLRQRDLDKRVLPAIAKAIPYKILFVLTFENEVQAWMEVQGIFYNTEWFLRDGFVLRFDGLNLDVIYENLVRQLAGDRLDLNANFSEAVNQDVCQQKLEREITALEKKMWREPQFNKQVELNSELKRLKKELK
jgi:hypothetical protein